MENIYNSNEDFINFDFNKLVLTKPTQITGGNYFIRFLMNNVPLYVQPPKSSTKQGIIKAGKRIYTDMMFTNENETFLNWMEKLENYCQKYIYNNRDKWFDSDIELHDVENYFTSPFKIYKSGKYYIIRVNISTVLGKPLLKIYDENETEISVDSINDKMNIMTILEIQGIKCSSRSFQIEIELKQIMVLKPIDLFEKCLFKTNLQTNKIQNIQDYDGIGNETNEPENRLENCSDKIIENEIDENKETTQNITQMSISEDNLGEFFDKKENFDNISIEIEAKNDDLQYKIENSIKEEEEQFQEPINKNKNENQNIENKKDSIEEIEFHLEELSENDTMKLKQRNDVYYDLYREAKQKAKIARDFAISAYLEAKEIKNKYFLDEISDSDDEDDDDFEYHDHEVDGNDNN